MCTNTKDMERDIYTIIREKSMSGSSVVETFTAKASFMTDQAESSTMESGAVERC